jgi:predicted transposase YbfD/YdcC
MAVWAVICGADGWEDIEEDGKAHAAGFAEVLDFPHGIPGHETLRRVLSRLDPDELTPCFLSWTAALSALSGGDIVASDGTTRRHAFARAAATAAIPMVSAGANRNRLVRGQVKVADKSNAMTALPQRLKMLDVPGATVTMEALGCQKEIAQVITEQGADDVVALQKNHRTLYDDVTLLLDDARAKAFAERDHASHETVEGDHGRRDIRQYGRTADIVW